MNNSKPPIGIIPKDIFKLERLKDVTKAIDRRIKAEWAIPIEWVEEYNELTEEVQSAVGKEELK